MKHPFKNDLIDFKQHGAKTRAFIPFVTKASITEFGYVKTAIAIQNLYDENFISYEFAQLMFQELRKQAKKQGMNLINLQLS